jgi:hypothetical protein
MIPRLLLFALCVPVVATGVGCSSEDGRSPTPASRDAGCRPEFEAAFCDRYGANCDPVTGLDNCGISRTINCGLCRAPLTCGGGGTPNVCGEPGADAGIAAPDGGVSAPFMLRATFAMALVGPQLSGAFDPLMGGSGELTLSFAGMTETKEPPSGGNPFTVRRWAFSSVASASASGHAILTTVAENVRGRPASITFGGQGTELAVVELRVEGAAAPVLYGIQVLCTTDRLGHDNANYPIPAPFSCAQATTTLRRYEGSAANVTDLAHGGGTMEWQQP